MPQPLPHPTRIPPGSARRNGFSLVIPVALLLAIAVFGFVVYRYRLLHHLPVIADLPPLSEVPVLADIPVLSSLPDADPALFPVAADQPGLAPAPPGFGEVEWQMAPGDVRGAEGIPPFRTSPTAIVYSLDLLNQPCLLTYFFRHERLYGVQFQFASPGSDFLPVLTPQQTRKLYGRIKDQMDSRYGDAVETTTTHPRPETEECTLRLQDARRRLDDLAVRLRAEHGDDPDAARLIENGLEEDRRGLAALEQELRSRQAADFADPLVSRLLSQWTSGPMSITLVADLATTPPSLEIRYKANSSRRPASVPTGGNPVSP